MAADQGNKTAMENFRALSEQLKDVDTELWQAANAEAQQAAETQTARRVRIAHLQRQIGELEMDARLEDSLAESGMVAVNASAMGTSKIRKEADKYRAEAARLRAELAGLDVLAASSTSVQ
jgi:hypothetical protein